MSTTTSRGSTAAKPSSAGSGPVKELTFRGIVIGGIITLIFTAANVYLGLKVGLTFATSRRSWSSSWAASSESPTPSRCGARS